MMSYPYNPHAHIKIWLSNNPDLFMNLENQMRLIAMREKNPTDTIHLLYDRSLISSASAADLHEFCKEHNLIPIDASQLQKELTSEREQKLYTFYREELANLGSGGNLAVASDILRWLSPVFRQGSYTDFDVPVDTSALPASLRVESPLLLNIGSLKIGRKEFILANNDYVAVIDETAAQEEIKRIQKGLLAKLTRYDNDFIEKTERELNKGYLNRYLLQLMKNRSESIYIRKSKEITADSSLNIRKYIQALMTDQQRFLEFNKAKLQDTEEQVSARLRKELQKQLNLVKYLFFRKDYAEIKAILKQKDPQLLAYLMKKEADLYLKSIVICSTGPIEIANALFDAYVIDTDRFRKEIQPFSFNHYGLKKSFRSQNSIPLQENIFGMLKFLGVADGQLSDSSWLDSGKLLQEHRIVPLLARQKALAKSIPSSIKANKEAIEAQIKRLTTDPCRKLFKSNIQEQIEELRQLLSCFNQENNEFDIAKFKRITFDMHQQNNIGYSRQTKKIMRHLEHICHDAVLFRLAKNKKIKLDSVS